MNKKAEPEKLESRGDFKIINMSCECLADLFTAGITLIGVTVTFTSIIIALRQYRDAKNFKKASFFIDLRDRFKTNQQFSNIRRVLGNGGNINEINQTDKYDYVGFFEELQIAINSKFIKPELVYYLFGYYIIQCDEAELIDRELPLWGAFKELANKMHEIRIDFKYSNNLKF